MLLGANRNTHSVSFFTYVMISTSTVTPWRMSNTMPYVCKTWRMSDILLYQQHYIKNVKQKRHITYNFRFEMFDVTRLSRVRQSQY